MALHSSRNRLYLQVEQLHKEPPPREHVNEIQHREAGHKRTQKGKRRIRKEHGRLETFIKLSVARAQMRGTRVGHGAATLSGMTTCIICCGWLVEH